LEKYGNNENAFRVVVCSLIGMLLIGWICCISVNAAELDASFKTDFYSKYVWRGFNLCDEAVIQPSLTIGKAPVSLNIWGSLNGEDQARCHELDYTLDYAFQVGKLPANIGYIYYTFPNLSAGDKTQEVYAGITAPGKYPLTLKLFHDYDEGRGTYCELAGSFPIPAGKQALAASVALGYNNHQWRESSGLSHAQVTLSTEFKTSWAVLAPIVGYSAALHHDFRDEAFYGVSVTPKW